jgi:hypothetical protein
LIKDLSFFSSHKVPHGIVTTSSCAAAIQLHARYDFATAELIHGKTSKMTYSINLHNRYRLSN